MVNDCFRLLFMDRVRVRVRLIMGYVWLLTVNNIMNGYFLMYFIDCY